MSEEHQKPLIGAYLLLFKDNQILLQKRKSGRLAGQYSLVAGHTEQVEDVIHAIQREAKEESNLLLDEKDLEVRVVVQRPDALYKQETADIIDFFIYADKYQGNLANNEPDKCSELKFFPINQLPDNILPHVKHVIETFFENKHCMIECG